MKKCTRCNLFFSLDRFKIMNKATGKVASMHDDCKRQYDNDYYNERSKEEKSKKYSLQKTRRKMIAKFFYNYLSKYECIDCGEKRIATLDFDHIKEKKFSISNGIKSGYSLKRLKNEIKKCEIRCANCHRMKTAKQFNWYNYD